MMHSPISTWNSERDQATRSLAARKEQPYHTSSSMLLPNHRGSIIWSWLLLLALVWPSDGFVSSVSLSARKMQSSLPPCFSVDRDRDDGGTRTSEDESKVTELKVSVLYESDGILAINKPQGISHHDDGQYDGELGILSLLRQAQTRGDLDYQGRLYGVHRLDRVTSGILILAKNAKMASTLTRAFREGQVTKYYVGVSSKKRTKKKQGWIKGNMVRGRRKSWYLTRGKDNDSFTNKAVTRFFTASLASLRHSAVDQEAPAMTLMLFRPYTGRTHQLRVAAKSVGLPLIGDPIYSDGTDSTSDAKRTCLHACAIHIDLDNEEPVTICSPLPFHHLYRSKEATEAFNASLSQLMQKHCDCDPILALMDRISMNSEV